MRVPIYAFAIAIGFLAAEASRAAPAGTEKPAGTMRDLRDHFAACFHPSAGAAGSRITFYFSLDAKGQVVARPRTVLFGFKGTPDEKGAQLAQSAASFAQCLPLLMSESLAASMPGKVYFLQYAIAESGATTEVLFRPFGSHGGGGGGGFVEPPRGLDPAPLEPAVPPLRISPVPAWMMRPRFRPLFPRVVPIPPRFPQRIQ